jgi:A/G-specific adenine glycosylase
MRPLKHGVAWWTERDNHVWLVRRPEKGLLGGMAALPGTDWDASGPEPFNPIGTIRHAFTHFALDLAVVVRSEPMGEGWWQPIATLDEAGLPTLYRKAADLALKADDQLAA